MVAISAALANAVELHHAGRLHAAEPIYRQILAVDPNHPHALHLLGVVAQQSGRNDIAVELIERAIAVDATNPAFHSSLGIAHLALRRFHDAVACCRRALKLDPLYVEGHINLGNAWKHQGRLGRAVACYRRALQLQPDSAVAHFNLGNVWYERGDLQSAAESYRQALAAAPNFAEAHHNLGAICREQGLCDEALARIRRSLELRPGNSAAHVSLGLASLDRGSTADALAHFQRAVELDHDLPEAQYCLGNLHADQGQFDQAVSRYQRAIELRPDFGAALGAMAHALQHLCRWDELPSFSQRVMEVIDGDEFPRGVCVSPMCLLTAQTTAAQQLRCARRYVDRQLHPAVNLGRRLGRARPAAGATRIRVGYLSADFRAHAIASLSVELFEKHDRGRFQVFGYSYGPDDGSPMRQRLAGAFDRFVDIRDQSYVDGARQIAADQIDILVDLTGHTRHARTQILALRPAPIQVSYLGYPGTMGAPFIDYLVADDFVVPDDREALFTEKLVWLPGCYQINSRRIVAPEAPGRRASGLPEDAFVFGAFNSSHKLTPAIFDVWIELLNHVPASVLWLIEKNRIASANLRRYAEVRGVSPERLVFTPRIPSPAHLARHRLVDLCLDTFPYNGHTTTSDALWAGCPVLTIAGETFASRVAGSLLRAVGLEELVTSSVDEYRALALQLAHHPPRLAELRARLAANAATSLLFDAAAFTRHLEAAYITMQELHMAGDRPRSFAVSQVVTPVAR